MVLVNNPARNGKPQPRSSRRSGPDLIRVPKAVKNVREIRIADADPGVGDRKHCGVVAAAKLNSNYSFGCVLDRVVDQNQQDAPESLGICADFDGELRLIDLKREAFVPGQFLPLFRRSPQDASGIDFTEFQRLASGIGTGKHHQTVHDLGRTFGFVKNIVQRFTVLGGRPVSLNGDFSRRANQLSHIALTVLSSFLNDRIDPLLAARRGRA